LTFDILVSIFIQIEAAFLDILHVAPSPESLRGDGPQDTSAGWETCQEMRNVKHVVLTHLQAQGHEVETAEDVQVGLGVPEKVGHDMQTILV
jgi:hypothetical protein